MSAIFFKHWSSIQDLGTKVLHNSEHHHDQLTIYSTGLKIVKITQLCQQSSKNMFIIITASSRIQCSDQICNILRFPSPTSFVLNTICPIIIIITIILALFQNPLNFVPLAVLEKVKVLKVSHRRISDEEESC